MVRFLKDIHDPQYVGNLYNINRPKGTPVVQIGENIKNHFGTFACKQATYKCRIQNQYIQLRREALKIYSIYRNTHEKIVDLQIVKMSSKALTPTRATKHAVALDF